MKIVLEGAGTIPNYGVVESNLHSSLDDAEFTLRREDDGSQATSFSADLSFFGSAFEYLKTHLIDSPNARENSIYLKVYDTCCNPERLIYTGVITAKTIDWCEIEDGERTECAINTSSEEATEGATLQKRLRQSLIIDNNTLQDGRKFWDIPHVQVPYCLFFQPSAFHYFLIVIGSFIVLTFLIFTPLFFVIGVIVGIINAIISFLGALFGGDPISLDDIWDDATGGFDSFREIFTVELPKWMTGCGKYHYGVLVRDYVNNAIVGVDPNVQFESSILNDPASDYYDLCLLLNPNSEGEEEYLPDYVSVNTKAYVYFSISAPNWTLGELLDKLAIQFNAEWYVDGTILRFEKKRNIQRFWLDLTALENEIERKCFTWDDAPYPVGVRFQYQPDGIDTCTDNAKYLFDDTVPFEPANANQDKLQDVFFQFASMRGRGDNLLPDPLVVFAPLFDVFSFFGLSIIKDEWENVMLLSSGKMNTAKLVVLEPNWDRRHALVIRKTGAEGKNYNYPMWVDAAYPPYNPLGRYDNQPNSIKRREGDNLWRFFTELDPINQQNLLGRNFEVVIPKDCTKFEALFDSTGQINFNISVQLLEYRNSVRALVTEVQVGTSTLTIKGKY